jgi:hypothetical protein
MSDNIDEILKLKASDGDAPKGAHLGLITGSRFKPSGFVVVLKVLAWISAIAAFFLLISINAPSAFAGFGASISLFISAHVIATIEKCAFYLEKLNKKK